MRAHAVMVCVFLVLSYKTHLCVAYNLTQIILEASEMPLV